MEKINCWISFTLLILIFVFIPDFYRYLYKSPVGKLFIILGIIYISRISILSALLFIFFVIISSYNYYEGFISNM